MSIFGPLKDSSDAEAALIAFLRDWMPTGIGRAVRLRDPKGELYPNGVSQIRSMRTVHLAPDKWPEDQLPMLLIQSPGEAEDPYVTDEGMVYARYGLSVMAIAEGREEENSKALARLYSSAARMVIAQNPSCGDVFTGLSMGRESNGIITRGVEAERSLFGVAVPYVVEMQDVLDITAGVREPLEDPSVEPPERPAVKEDGGSVEVQPGADALAQLKQSGFFQP